MGGDLALTLERPPVARVLKVGVPVRLRTTQGVLEDVVRPAQPVPATSLPSFSPILPSLLLFLEHTNAIQPQGLCTGCAPA
jgi:hypothetical protein